MNFPEKRLSIFGKIGYTLSNRYECSTADYPAGSAMNPVIGEVYERKISVFAIGRVKSRSKSPGNQRGVYDEKG